MRKILETIVSSLNYQEQYQLFLWKWDYFVERVSTPGGLADYLSEMVTQMNYLPVVGAILIVLLFLCLQTLTWMVCRRLGATRVWYGLSFLPVLVLWVYQSDPNVLQSFTIALIATMAVACALVGRKRLNYIGLVVLLPVFYWLFGVAVYVLALFCIIEALRRRQWIGALLLLVYSVAIVFASVCCLPYPESRVLVGLHYYRYPVGVPVMQWVVMGVAILVPYLCMILPRWRNIVASITLSLVILVVGVVAVWTSFNDVTHELMAYDYLVRVEKWDDIIRRAEKGQVASPMDVSVVNLALSQRGQLLDRLFDFYQNGGEGLFPSFTRDILSPIPTSEVFFRLGMVNDCERYCFEAMQAIPDHRLSGRLLKRIVQCEVANGNYDVARRYLKVLERSTFYRRWARTTLALLDDEEKINANPTYARLRENREQHTDYLFSEQEMDQMVGLLLMNNPKNRMAYEYLIAYELLQRDLERFNEYYVLGRNIDYKRIPTVVQEVLIGQWLRTHNDLRGIPYTLDAAGVAHPPYTNNTWTYLLKGGGNE